MSIQSVLLLLLLPKTHEQSSCYFSPRSKTYIGTNDLMPLEAVPRIIQDTEDDAIRQKNSSLFTDNRFFWFGSYYPVHLEKDLLAAVDKAIQSDDPASESDEFGGQG